MNINFEEYIDQIRQVQQLDIEGRVVDAFNILNKMKNNLGVINTSNSYSDDERQLIFNVYYLLFEIQWKLFKSEECFNYGEIAAEIISDYSQKVKVYYNLTIYSMQLNKLESSHQYIQLAEACKSPIDKALILQSKARLLQKEHNYEDAISVFCEAAYEAEGINQTRLLVRIILDMAESWEQIGKHEIALNEIERATKIAKDTHDFNFYLRAVVKKVKLLYRLGKDADAKQLLLTLQYPND